MIRRLHAVGWLLLVPGSALAGDAVSMSGVTSVAFGNQDPSLTFTSAVEGTLSVELSCAGKPFPVKRAVRPGDAVTVALKGLPMGSHRCTGTLRVDERSGAWAEMPLDVGVALLPTLDWRVSADDYSAEEHRLVVHPSRPLREAEVELIGLGGAILARETATLIDPSNPTFSWVVDDEVLKLVVTATDEAGTRGQLTLSPWSYAIPHEDVVFPSGSHDIPKAETGKLERCWSDVRATLDKYGSVVDIELFVAGYTDTVGTADSNQGLSERRARSIAGWFRARGFSGPIWYQGFGEDVLAVPTPDETDQLANRRALYVLAAQVPQAPELPRDDWKRLQ